MIKEALDAYAESSKKIWQHDRSLTVGASEVGACARKTAFAKRWPEQADPDYKDGWGARVRGTVFEDAFWVPAIQAYAKAKGYELLYAGEDQKTFSKGYLSSTGDGLVVKGAYSVALDCKSIDPRINLEKPKPEHVFQVIVQMGMYREFTNHKPDHAIISYSNTSFWNDVSEFTIEYDPAIYQAAQVRAHAIMNAETPFDLKPEGYIAGARECEYCPFTQACNRTQVQAIPVDTNPIDEETSGRLLQLAKEYRAHKDECAEADSRAKEAQEDIRQLLAGAASRKVSTDQFTISWSPVKGRETWDMPALIEAATAAGLDVDRYRKTGEGSDRLNITLKDAKA